MEGQNPEGEAAQNQPDETKQPSIDQYGQIVTPDAQDLAPNTNWGAVPVEEDDDDEPTTTPAQSLGNLRARLANAQQVILPTAPAPQTDSTKQK
jgi:hypothetical protein